MHLQYHGLSPGIIIYTVPRDHDHHTRDHHVSTVYTMDGLQGSYIAWGDQGRGGGGGGQHTIYGKQTLDMLCEVGLTNSI